MDYLQLMIQLVPIVLVLCYYVHQKYNYWSKRGVKGPSLSIFKFSNLLQINGRDPLSVEPELVSKYGRVYGVYTGLKPTLTVADAELIKQIFIKDFPLFSNRRKLNAYHEMGNNGLLFADVEQWKRLRTISSPTFSSGKLRNNVQIMNQCIGKFDRYLGQLTNSNGSGIVHDLRDAIIGLTIEVAATTVFGIETYSNEDRTKENPFVVFGLKSSDVPSLRALSYFTAPKWWNYLMGVEHVFNVEAVDFYTKIIVETIKRRKLASQNGTARQNDLIQLLIDASADEDEIKSNSFDKLTASMDQGNFTQTQKSEKPKITLTESEIHGVAMVVFFGGFETTALTLSCCIFELSRQQDLQERLFNLLNEQIGDFDGNSDEYFDVVMNRIPYLDAVIKETLRKYPALTRLERRLTGVDSYKLGGIELQKDQTIEIPTVAVHYNPEYYPEPELYNPERFMPENKHQLVPYTYLPFGDGPRNCMGMRYAYQEMKLFLAQIVRRYRFSPTVDTPKKLKFLPFKFVMAPESFSIGVEKRINN